MAARSVLVLLNTVDDAAGGNLRAAVNIAEALAAGGDAVTFSAPVGPGTVHRTVDLMDNRVERRLFSAPRLLARLGGSLGQAWWLVRAARRFDEVQTHSLFTLSAMYAILVCRLRRVPVVLWPHGSIDPFDLRKHARVKRALAPLLRCLIDSCSALFFTTPHESRVAVTWGATTPRFVVPLPVAPLRVDAADSTGWRRRHGVPAHVPMVLCLGRIDYKKRLPLLAETISLLDHDAHLVVVGDGPESQRALLREAADRHGISHRLHVTGWLEGDDRIQAFAAADVFALLSDAENFGLSIIEAMSAGCPVVISDRVALAPDLEAAGAALVVPQVPARAAAAIDRVLGDPDAADAIVDQGRAYVERHFAPGAVAQRLVEIAASLAPVSESQSRPQTPASRLYPEIAAGGYARRDGFVDFFVRVRSLLARDSVVLDFGAGRGAWNEDPEAPRIFPDLRDLRTTGARVIGVDVDPVVLENTSLDERHVIEPADRLPLDDASVDLVVADHVLEHVTADDAPTVVAELSRVLKPGGWVCARTPNKWGLIGVAARVVPNDRHVAALRRLQPGRHAEDVFPTRYRMNTRRDLRRLFPPGEWTLAVYGHPGVQQYAGSSVAAWRAAALIDRVTPGPLSPTLMVFARKDPG